MHGGKGRWRDSGMGKAKIAGRESRRDRIEIFLC